jgi:hypothetical protein
MPAGGCWLFGSVSCGSHAPLPSWLVRFARDRRRQVSTAPGSPSPAVSSTTGSRASAATRACTRPDEADAQNLTQQLDMFSGSRPGSVPQPTAWSRFRGAGQSACTALRLIAPEAQLLKLEGGRTLAVCSASPTLVRTLARQVTAPARASPYSGRLERRSFNSRRHDAPDLSQEN